ncbi:MAG: hypothetical protein CMJ48_15115 [Planctomycetaceae bacterium]|nr:hypothetical protein [Planctomycetaceae bacterium]
MPEEQDQKRKSGFWPVVVVLLFLFVAYVASYGPVVAAHNAGRLPTGSISVLNAIYAPLDWASRHVPGVKHRFRRYVDLWK